jgi:hypothetical protein
MIWRAGQLGTKHTEKISRDEELPPVLRRLIVGDFYSCSRVGPKKSNKVMFVSSLCSRVEECSVLGSQGSMLTPG